jgi:hypothetical protein
MGTMRLWIRGNIINSPKVCFLQNFEHEILISIGECSGPDNYHN